MTREIQIPEIAENVTEGTVIGLLVGEGDTIAADQNILEMETDKASVEVPAPFGGEVEEILVAEGDEVSVGQTVMKVRTDEADENDESGEKEPRAGGEPQAGAERERQAGPDGEASRGRAESRSGTKDKDRERRDAGQSEGDEEAKGAKGAEHQEAEPGASGDDRSRASGVPASPATRRLAREIGVDITRVEGSGPGGRVSSEDVKAHARGEGRGAGPGREGSGGRSGAKRDEGAAAGERREPMTRVRRLTAERTAESWRTVPHVTQHGEADLTRVNEYVARMAPKVEKAGGKLTVTAILVKLVAQALRVYPRFNASADMDAGEVIYHDRIAIGIAADTERGLLVPIVRDPDTKGIVDLAIEIGELAARARGGDLDPSELQGATFTVSNLGGIGGTSFTPVIVPPAVAILGVARSRTQPIYNGRSFEPREVLPLSLSYDHRVIDGADGARFVVWLQTAMEDPLAAMMEGGR